MKKLIIPFLFCVATPFLFNNCKEPEDIKPELNDSIQYLDGAIFTMPCIWKARVSDEQYNWGMVQQPIIYNNAALAMCTRNDSLILTMHNAQTGNVAWEKPRKIRMNKDYFDQMIKNAYQKNNYLINPYFTSAGKYGFENIDLRSGEYIWEKEITSEVWFDYPLKISGIDSLFFFYGKDRSEIETGRYPNAIYCASVETGDWRKVCVPPFVKQQSTDSVIVEVVFPAKVNNTTYVFVGYSYKNEGYIGLFNMQQNTWIYANKKVNGKGFVRIPFVEDNRFYINTILGPLICGDIESGNIIWEDSLFSMVNNMVVSGDNIIGCGSYTNNALSVIAKNKFTGKKIWEYRGSRPNSYIQELNGIIYFDAGLIYALDANTGKLLWHLKPQDGSRFNECTVVPGIHGEKGRVIGRADRYAYCFEAIK